MADLAGIVASIPPNENPFAYLRRVAVSSLAPTDPDWVIAVLHSYQALYAVTAILPIIGLTVRWRKGKIWFFKTTTLPGGNLLVPHPVHCTAAGSVVFGLGAVAVTTYQIYAYQQVPKGDPAPYVHLIVAQIYLIPLAFLAWLDMAGVVTSLLSHRTPQNGRSRLRKLPTWPFQIFFYVTPCLFVAALFAGFGWLGHVANELVAKFRVVDSFLAEHEATYTGGAYIPTLLQIVTQSQDLNAYGQTFIDALKIPFGILAAWLVMLIVLWTPANIVQIMMLWQQIFVLRQNSKHKSTTITPSDPMSPKSQNKSQVKSHTKSKGQGSTNSADAINNRANALVIQCWVRLLSVIAYLTDTVCYLGLCFWLIIKPESSVHPLASSITLGIAPGAVYLSVALPILAAFVWHSFDLPGSTPAHNIDTSGMAISSAGGQLSRMSRVDQLSSIHPPPLKVKVEVDRAMRIDVDDAYLETKEKADFVHTPTDIMPRL